MKLNVNIDNIWVYEREGGDCGIIIAKTYGNALDELRKMYTDIDKRLSEEACKRNGWTWGLNVFGLDEVEQSENGKVFVTAPI